MWISSLVGSHTFLNIFNTWKGESCKAMVAIHLKRWIKFGPLEHALTSQIHDKTFQHDGLWVFHLTRLIKHGLSTHVSNFETTMKCYEHYTTFYFHPSYWTLFFSAKYFLKISIGSIFLICGSYTYQRTCNSTNIGWKTWSCIYFEHGEVDLIIFLVIIQSINLSRATT